MMYATAMAAKLGKSCISDVPIMKSLQDYGGFFCCVREKEKKRDLFNALLDVAEEALDQYYEDLVLKKLNALRMKQTQKPFSRKRSFPQITHSDSQLVSQENLTNKKKKMQKQPMVTLAIPDDIPADFKERILSIGGFALKYLMTKRLFQTDLSESHNRLSLPWTRIKADFLSEKEKGGVMRYGGEGLDVVLIEPSLEKCMVRFKLWKMPYLAYVFISAWGSVRSRNRLREDSDLDNLFVRLKLMEGRSNILIICCDGLRNLHVFWSVHIIWLDLIRVICNFKLDEVWGWPTIEKLCVHCAEALGRPIVGDYKYGWFWYQKWKQMPQVGFEPITGKHYKLRRPEGLDVQKGSVLSKVPLLHLHRKELVLPNIAKFIEILKPNSEEHLVHLSLWPNHLSPELPLPSNRSRAPKEEQSDATYFTEMPYIKLNLEASAVSRSNCPMRLITPNESNKFQIQTMEILSKAIVQPKHVLSSSFRCHGSQILKDKWKRTIWKSGVRCVPTPLPTVTNYALRK
ncbi:B3 domain-containing protein At2g31720-like [Dillenia turbinata]|uniref:B3 domain-containing protein At2g31720-like n=1 Tax=Dillenia turbinata TaxID=194707 RepID=A0AAN8YQ94_9MAGN